eukprot:TRINITY_DN12726_c0_g1_i2.p1 TRINITY_DN12726_c0_g1~~TRINITY_DN12726_c0_g1_i2.p1  ORF type:complete len:515 (+),score=34.70 TRINITY_DN12726_c0_g1_i2:63-1607(+)
MTSSTPPRRQVAVATVAVLLMYGGAATRHMLLRDSLLAAILWEMVLCCICSLISLTALKSVTEQNVKLKQVAKLPEKSDIVKSPKTRKFSVNDASYKRVSKRHRSPVSSQRTSALHTARGYVPQQWSVGKALGATTMRGGGVHRCLDHATGKIFAVKLQEESVPTTEVSMFASKLQSEIEILQTIGIHENVVRMFGHRIEYFEEGKSTIVRTCMMQELGDQGSLRSIINNFGKLPPPLVRFFTIQLLKGLTYIHARDIVHRDIKADNIIIHTRGKLQFCDFGEATRLPITDIPTNFIGSALWMAPEVLVGGRHTKCADMWSLGCTVFEMLTGSPPECRSFCAKGNDLAMLFKLTQKVRQPPEIPESTPQELKSLFKKVFAPMSERPSASELLGHAWFEGEENQGNLFSAAPSPMEASIKSLDSSSRSSSGTVLILKQNRTKKVPRRPKQISDRLVLNGSIVARTTSNSSLTNSQYSEVIECSMSTLAVALRWLGKLRGDRLSPLEHYLSGAIQE